MTYKNPKLFSILPLALIERNELLQDVVKCLQILAMFTVALCVIVTVLTLDFPQSFLKVVG